MDNWKIVIIFINTLFEKEYLPKEILLEIAGFLSAKKNTIK